MNQQSQEQLAAFIHGVLALGHAIGLIYNYKRRNRFDVAVHGFALIYDLKSTAKHIRAI